MLAVAVDLHGDVEAVGQGVAEAGLHGAADPEVEGKDEEPGSGSLRDRSGAVV